MKSEVASYIARFPPKTRRILTKIRATIRRTAPGATESITYRIPTYKVNGRPLVYFAGFKSHIGLYPVTPDVKAHFKKDLAGYKGGKGTVRFPLDEAIPYGLITKIVRFKMKQARS
jgi:uncharacterized protein YdhG (YjbR/CyaY superfamily)